MDDGPCNLPFHVSVSSGTPIYRQIVEQVQALVAGGQLAPGDMLPSVRQVAQALQVNPMTVSKAYSWLENEGLLERVRGRGMRVACGESSVIDRQAMLRPLLMQAVVHARQLGLTDVQITSQLQRILKEKHT
ncbi:MAG: GntR family transcriptional regulator [Phycisphaeraceae bacterium]|nr:GntR family transcriptional regulator [Phycisphaeraceae bacterium]